MHTLVTPVFDTVAAHGEDGHLLSKISEKLHFQSQITFNYYYYY